MAIVTSTIEILCNLNGRVSAALIVRYGINLRVKQDVSIRNDIADTDRLSRSVSVLCNLVDKAVVQHASTCTLTVSGIVVEASFLSIEVAEGSYCITLEATLASEKDWLACTAGSALVATINDVEYGFIIDSPGRNRGFRQTSYTVRARSKTSLLDFPAADAVSFTNAATTASALCSSLCTACGILLDWRILDWPLAAGLIVAEGEAPLSIISKIAAAAGGILQSSLDGETLIVQYRYAGGTAERIFTDELDILSWSETMYTGRGFNCVRISDRNIVSEDESTYIYIELDEERNGGKSQFVLTDTIYLRVYSSALYTMQVTAGTLTKIVSDEVLAAEPSVLIFDGDTYPSVNKPIESVGSTVWYGNDLGAVSKAGASELSAAEALPTTLGILKAAYNVKYDVWRLVPPATASGEYYIYVKSAQTGDA